MKKQSFITIGVVGLTVLSMSAFAAPKKHKRKKKGNPEASETATASTAGTGKEKYCEYFADQVLTVNGLGTFANPSDEKVKVKDKTFGAGFLFKSDAMKTGEGVYVYPKHAGKSLVRTVYFNSDNKKHSIDFSLKGNCTLTGINGVYGPTGGKVFVNKPVCAYTEKATRRPASLPFEAYSLNKGESEHRRKDVARMKTLGGKSAGSGYREFVELCTAYGPLFHITKKTSEDSVIEGSLKEAQHSSPEIQAELPPMESNGFTAPEAALPPPAEAAGPMPPAAQ